MEAINPTDMAAGGIAGNSASSEGVKASGHYVVQCLDKDGNVKWEDTIQNLVTNVGKAFLLDTALGPTASYTAAWALGLVDGGAAPTYAAGDTMASHAGWTENQTYSNATRPVPTFNAASAGSKSTTATGFSINGAATIAGCFLTTVSTKGGTTGTLYSCGSFTGGNKIVANGDTLNVTYTATA